MAKVGGSVLSAGTGRFAVFPLGLRRSGGALPSAALERAVAVVVPVPVRGKSTATTNYYSY